MLVNNNFSNKTIDIEIKKALDKLLTSTNQATSREDRGTTHRLFYKNQMSPAYQKDEKVLRDIVRRNVSAVNENDKVQLLIYYQNKKASSLAMKNNLNEEPLLKSTDVVYVYKCPFGDCKLRKNVSYIGQTSTTLSRRLTCHLQSGAPQIHTETVHGRRLSRRDLVENTTILARQPDRRRLIIMEAFYIRDLVPQMNSQQDIQGICKLYDTVPKLSVT